MKTITLGDAMRKANLGKVFDCAVVTADEKRKIGGELIKLTGCQLAPLSKKEAIRDPGHHHNDTRNLISSDGKIIKIHPRLMTEFDGKELIY